jgi:hypothetical protein
MNGVTCIEDDVEIEGPPVTGYEVPGFDQATSWGDSIGYNNGINYAQPHFKGPVFLMNADTSDLLANAPGGDSVFSGKIAVSYDPLKYDMSWLGAESPKVTTYALFQ